MINNLLYNYQDTNEFVCLDGRMSVNGICKVQQQDSVEAADTTQTIIDVSKGDGADDRIKQKEFEDKVRNDKVLDDLAQDGTPDYFPDLGKEKKSFSWDMDKPSKVKDFKNTISDNISAYNSFIEKNLGIPSDIQTGMRVGASGYALASGGSLAAVLGPFALPALIGNAIVGKEKDRIETITNQDTQGNDNNAIDMMTYDIPNYGEKGYNIHSDAGDKPDFRNTTQDQGADANDGFGQNNNAGGGTFGNSVNDNSSFSDYS